MYDTAEILIVEDSPTQAEKLQVILEGDGNEAVVAHDAQDALGQLAAGGFDLVISDIVMPGMSGYELCREIKAHPGWRHVPVILLTTRKDPMDIFRGLECGADNFYTKPYDAQRLLDRVRHILHNRQLRAAGKLRPVAAVEAGMDGRTSVDTAFNTAVGTTVNGALNSVVLSGSSVLAGGTFSTPSRTES